MPPQRRELKLVGYKRLRDQNVFFFVVLFTWVQPLAFQTAAEALFQIRWLSDDSLPWRAAGRAGADRGAGGAGPAPHHQVPVFSRNTSHKTRPTSNRPLSSLGSLSNKSRLACLPAARPTNRSCWRFPVLMKLRANII